MKPLLRQLLLLLPLLAALGARAQSTIQQEGFAGTPGTSASQVDNANTTSYTSTVTNTASSSAATKQYFVRGSNGSPPTDVTPGTADNSLTGFTPTTGIPAGGTFPTTDNFFWAGEAVQGTAGTGAIRTPGIVQLNSVSIAGYASLQVKIGLFTARNTGTTWEPDDKLEVQVKFDGGSTWNTVGRIVGDNTSGTTGLWRQDANLDGSSADDAALATPSPFVTSPMSDFTFPITGSGSTIQVRVVVTEVGLSEEFAFDNIRLLGTVNSSAPPMLANLETATINYAEGSGAVQITNNITISDADNTTLSGAVIRLLNFDATEDRLLFSTQNSISGTYNATTGILSLTGTATLANYQTALRSIQYQDIDAADARDGTRTIQFSVTDASGVSSGTVTRDLTVTSSLDAATPPPFTDDLTTDGEGTRYKSNSFVTPNAAGQAFFRTNIANNEANGPFHSSGVAATTFTNISNGYYWYSAGTGLPANPSTPKVGTFITKQINAVNYANLHFRILLGATIDSWEVGDYSKFYYRLNGGTWTIFASFRSTDQVTTTNSSTGDLAQDANPNNLGSAPTGTVLGPALQQFDYTLPTAVNGQQVDFMIESFTNDSNNNGEVFVFDKIEVTGSPQTTVNSIVRASANPNNAATVNYTVTFGAPVTGLTASNFTLTTSGLSGATVGTPVSTGTGSTWTVPVNTGTGSGSLTLNLANDTNLSVSISTPLPFAGETYTIDKTAPVPTITSSTVPTNGGSTSTSPIAYTVTFSETVTGFIAGDVSVSNGTLTGFTAVSGTTYTFNVTPMSNGTVSVAVLANVAQDVAGNSNTAATTYSVTYTQPVTAAPVIVAPANGSLIGTANPVYSGTAPANATITVFVDGTSIGTTQATGSGSFSLTQPTALGQGSHTVFANAQSSGSAVSPYSNTNTFTVDTTPPTVTSSNRQTPAAATTNATSLTFRVAFSEPVTGVSTGSFAFTATSGTVVGTIASVASVGGSNNTQFDVVVNGVSGNGTVRLDVKSSGSGIIDAAGNALSGGYTSGQTYTIDQTAPTVVITSPNGASGGTTTTSPLSYSVTFSESVTGFSATSITVTNGSVTSGPSGTSPGTTFTFTVTPTTAGTATTVAMPANATQDAAGNGNTASATYSLTYTPPVVAPTVTTAAAASITVTSAVLGGNVTANGGGTVTARGVVYSMTSTNGTPIIGGTGVTNAPNGSGTGTFSATISGLAPGTAYSVQAYATNSAGTSYGGVQTFTTTAAPALTATVSTTSSSPTSTATIPFSVSFSQSVGTTFIASDVTVANGTVTSGSFSGSGSGPYTFTVTPSGAGTVTVSVAAGVANDANNTQNTASNSVSVQYQLLVTAAPALTSPANNATTSSLPTFAGTAPAGSTVTIYLATGSGAATAIGTTTATSGGNFSFTPTTALAGGSYSAYATAQSSGASGSAPSNTNTFTVDATAPTVLSSNRQSPTATTTNATSLTFRVTFSEAVTGVDAPDFTATTTGTVTSSGRTVSAVSGSVYDVTVNGVSGNGTVRLDLNASGTGITDAVGNPISGGYTSGQTYTIDQTAPTVALSTTATSPTATAPIPFSATFSEVVTGFSASSISVTNGTVTSGSVSGSGSGPYTFTVTPTGSGTVTVSILANAAQDAAGNGNTASIAVSVTYSLLTTWTAGAGSQDWFTAGNWSAGVPTASTDALIPASVRFYPLVTAAGAVTRALTINSPGSVTLAIVGTLTVNGLLTNGGTITQSAGTLTVNGNMSMSGTISKSAGTISVSGSLSNTGTLNQSGGDFAVGGSLTNNTSGTVSQTGGTLSVNGDLTNNGTFTTTNAAGTGGGTVLLGGGSTSSNILGSSAIRFYNLTIQASGAQLSTSAGASVRRVLTLNGNFATNSSSFTIESASTGDALVVNNGSSVVTGNVTVQRYIDPSLNSGPGYRHYSAPVSSSTVGDLATPTGFSPVVNPAYNSAANPSFVVPFPNVFGYDESRVVSVQSSYSAFDRGYYSPAALSDPLTPGRGYTVNIGATQLVDFVGALNNGPVPLTLTSNRASNADAGWHLVGNPYPAPLDYRLVAAADRLNLEGAIYVFSSTSQYGGQYRAYTNNVGNPYIPLGQGFFARVATGFASGALTFRNSQRLTVPNATTFQRPAETRPLVQLTLQGTGSPLSDDAYVYFEQGATDGLDPQYDAVKLPNTSGLNLSTSTAGQQFSIDGRGVLGTTSRVVPLAVGVPTPGSYTLTTTQLLNLSSVPVYLRDRQSGALIDLAQQPTYTFTVASASAPLTGRFELVFSPQQPLATAPAALAEQVGLYPNPATTNAWLELPLSLSRQPVTATLVDAVGRPVRTQVLPAGRVSHTLLLNDLATGIYALRLTTEAGLVVKKLVIE